MRFTAVLAALFLGACAHHAPAPSAPPATHAASSTPSSSSSPAESLPPLPAPPPPKDAGPPPPPKLTLPLGGREIFPKYRLVGFCGTPGAAPALGRLAGNLSDVAKKIRTLASQYGDGREPLLVFELIAVVVQAGPGKDGKWRRRVPDSVVEDYLKAARAAKAVLLLNIQPGRSDFLTEAKSFERWLKEPDVGLALDPEWAMHGKQTPGAIFGNTNAAAINGVAEYLGALVHDADLPEKVLVYHQVNHHVFDEDEKLTAHEGVALVKSVDGLGPKGAKIATYKYLVKTMTPVQHAGFKLFFDEDKTNGGILMTPKEVLALDPVPEYVMYE